jgi:hypothetical protein
MTKNRSPKKKKKVSRARRWLQKKLSRLREPLPDTPQVVGHFLAKAGLRNCLPEQEYRDLIYSRFREETMALKSASAIEDTDQECAAKNSSLAFSQVVTSQECGDRIEKQLNWFVGAELPAPQRILDVGCDNGLMT